MCCDDYHGQLALDSVSCVLQIDVGRRLHGGWL